MSKIKRQLDQALQTLIQTGKLLHFLSISDVLNLALTFKPAWDLLSEIIPSLVYFKLDKKQPFKWYRPQKVIYNNNEKLEANSISPTVVHLTFGKHFNQPVNSHLPSSLLSLTFGDKFNQQIKSLPPSLTHLSIGISFIQAVDSLPPSLTHLTFEGKFNRAIDHLPPSLTHLTFSIAFNESDPEYISIMNQLNDPENNLSNTLGMLSNYNRERKARESKFNQPVHSLPLSLTHLVFATHFNQPVDSLPLSLTHLTFGEAFNYPINSLPPSLKYLEFSNAAGQVSQFNHPIDSLPPSLTHLILQTPKLTHPIKNILPATLTHLVCEGNRTFESLPSSLLHISFGKDVIKTCKSSPLCCSTCDILKRYGPM